MSTENPQLRDPIHNVQPQGRRNPPTSVASAHGTTPSPISGFLTRLQVGSSSDALTTAKHRNRIPLSFIHEPLPEIIGLVIIPRPQFLRAGVAL